jgi:SAM-dependent methyltransferase
MTDQQAYDDWHRHLAAGEPEVEAPTHPWHVTVDRLLPDLSGQRVLEIGCGRGDFAIWLAGKHPGARISGVDFSPVAIEAAQRRAARAGAGVEFHVGDAEDLAFADATFDWVISCECIEHLHHPRRMAREMHRLLRPGGRFVLTTESYFNGMLLAWLKHWITGDPYNSGSGVQPHENFFLFWTVRRLLEHEGLEVTDTESNGYQWLLLPRTAPARLATREFTHPLARRVFKPFGRHFTFVGRRGGGGQGS